MIETEKRDREAQWLLDHTLTNDQFKQLIQNKLDRAKIYQRAVKEQERIQSDAC